MELKNKIEICVGIGLDQFTPEYVVIEFDNSQEETLFPEKLENANKILEQTKDSLPKKRVRKPKKGGSEQSN
jgi:hypothetical protein